MLKSVYENGGFWVGRYEAGTSDYKNRKDYEEITEKEKVVTQKNVYPYRWIRRDEAQNLANRMNYENCTSSLMFGVSGKLFL